MAKLRLTSPRFSNKSGATDELIEVDVSVDTPAPHLDGEYTYLAEKGSLSLGSLVKVPFGAGETFGFITRIGSKEGDRRNFKPITRVLIPEQLFDASALARYRRIVELYGGSLISILKLAIPMRRSVRANSLVPIKGESELLPSSPDQKFLTKYFGFWEMESGKNLLLGPGILWDHVAISIFLANPARTAIMVPTGRDLEFLEKSLRERGFTQFHVVSSGLGTTERSRQFFGMLKSGYPLVIGTRSIAYAPTSFKRVIIIDPGHSAYQEPRAPYFRSDDPSLWDSTIIALSHTRELSAIARDESYQTILIPSRCHFKQTSQSQLISDLQNAMKSRGEVRSILVSLNDRSFASGLLCGECKNRTVCDCGFPLSIAHRGAQPGCSKCGRTFDEYRCRYCNSNKITSIRVGNQSWALSIAKSIKDARVILSDASNDKSKIVLKEKEVVVVIATQGFEPRIYDERNRFLGFDLVALMGGSAGFNSSTLSKADQYRRAWARILGLVNPKKANVLIDLERSHVEFNEISRSNRSPGIENLLEERKSLSLPPYAILVKVFGESNALIKLRLALQEDALLQKAESVLYPVQNESFIIKVSSADRSELLHLLQNVVKIRSAKRLTPIRFHVAPEDL